MLHLVTESEYGIKAQSTEKRTSNSNVAGCETSEMLKRVNKGERHSADSLYYVLTLSDTEKVGFNGNKLYGNVALQR